MTCASFCSQYIAFLQYKVEVESEPYLKLSSLIRNLKSNLLKFMH